MQVLRTSYYFTICSCRRAYKLFLKSEKGIGITSMSEDQIQHEMQSRIDELEMKVAHLEHTIDQLNEVITKVQNEHTLNQEALRYLYSQLENVREGSGGATMQNEPPPPHY